ncbi:MULTISPECIES: vanadium-dependent haloperoxidase [unclassified Microcoleus]|uniref:vanadium-dependent haloperoxidase n=1 Tax=unclassified Microcoleus TaxID=2642155 RepID=UPI002FD13A23
MVHAAIYDAANAIGKTQKVYKVQVESPACASAEAAAVVVAAAHRVLTNLYPKQTATLDAAKTASLVAIAEGKSKTDGVQLGEFVANKILEWRKNDGATVEVKYTPVNQPGYWPPIPPDLKPASMPQWKNVKPFAMTKSSQFQIAKMPSLTSEEYTAEFNKLKELGAKNSKIRTADKSAIAKIWLDSAGTITPPGHWNQIAADVAVRRGNTFEQNVRLFAVLNIALADASIIDGDQKYTFNRWRPLTGIQQADKDGNPKTTTDANWTPLLNTPSSPSSVSGHSTFGGAADAVLTKNFLMVPAT